MTDAIYLNELGIINALGAGKEQVRRNMLDGQSPGMGSYISPISGKDFYAGQVLDPLPTIPPAFKDMASRNCQLLLAALLQMKAALTAALAEYPAERIGVVIGTSTGGVAATEFAMTGLKTSGRLPQDYRYRQQEIGTSAEFVADYLQVKGPAWSISTACSSSGKVFASARGLIEQDLCDAVITGGADSLCELTLNGFAALEALADDVCNPFSSRRNGINVGEGAALFLMSRKAQGVLLAGVGESSDAHHMSAPDPRGDGAQRAMLAALADAGLQAADIDYLNLHGTATALNDMMESKAVHAVFAGQVPSSSSKPLTGHTLGAAGATEAGLCWLLLNDPDRNKVIPHLYDGCYDPAFCKIPLCETAASQQAVNVVMSNSFAFGGNNVSVILERNHES